VIYAIVFNDIYMYDSYVGRSHREAELRTVRTQYTATSNDNGFADHLSAIRKFDSITVFV